jgi:unsaturated chondroitin disaccharide hydrolase
MFIDSTVGVTDLEPLLARFFGLAAGKIQTLHDAWDPGQGTPVFTANGTYTTRGWTEWTQGFMYGCQILQFDATGDEAFLELGRENTLRYMAPHVSHMGVHDHGFNNISTYGNLRRLTIEGRVASSAGALAFYELAIKVSGAVQASRWTRLHDGTGYIHSFNGAHSLFSDTIRSCRILLLAHRLGHVLMGENDVTISLLGRALEHMRNTARYNVYYGEGRDIYDVPGRVAHESIFNAADGRYRCPSTQQGYSPFSTWTRGLAWIVLGYAEALEFMAEAPDAELEAHGGRVALEREFTRAAQVTADYYVEHTARDGIPYWDTGAPGLAQMPACYEQASQPDNPHEPADSSAAVIAAQGLLRLGDYLGRDGDGQRYWQAGLNVARTVLSPPYLSEDPDHQGLILHSVYHRPNGWDHVPSGKHVPQGESSMWGDYHAMELGVYLMRVAQGGRYLTFWA